MCGVWCVVGGGPVVVVVVAAAAVVAAAVAAAVVVVVVAACAVAVCGGFRVGSPRGFRGFPRVSWGFLGFPPCASDLQDARGLGAVAIQNLARGFLAVLLSLL